MSASFFAGYAATPQVFAAGGTQQKFADNVGRVLRVHARQSYLRQLRDRAAADRPLQAGAQAERPDALCRRRQGARRRHRDLRRAAARHRRPAVRLHPSELHPSAAAGRRELRQLPRRPGRRRRRQALSAAAVRAARQRLRLSAVEPVRRIRLPTSCSTTCSCRGSTCSSTATSNCRATSGGRRRRISTAITRRRCATSPSCASWRASPSA